MTPAPTSCPLCGAAVSKHLPETPEDYECWLFDCDAEIVRMESGKLCDEEPCGDAFRLAVQKLNEAA